LTKSIRFANVVEEDEKDIKQAESGSELKKYVIVGLWKYEDG